MTDSQAKKFLDAVLLLLFFVELGGMFLPTAAHECLGIAFIILLILHNVKNRHFYANIRRGKYSARRMANTVCVFLFALSLSAALVSGVVMSKNILPQIGFADVCNWRSLHLEAAIFSLVLLFVHLFFHAGKYIHGKSLVAVSALIFVLAATGIFGLPYLDRWYHQVNVDKSEILRGEKIAAPGRVLTVYFSRVGNTDFPPGVDAVSGASIMKDREEIIGNAEMIALIVQDIIGGEIVPVRTVKKYPADYGRTTQEGKREFDRGELPLLQENNLSMQDYDIIVVVYPLWWDTLPMAMKGFLQSYDLSDKTVIPIVTHGGGGSGRSVEAIRDVASPKAIVPPLTVYSSDIPASRQAIFSYFKNLNIF